MANTFINITPFQIYTIEDRVKNVPNEPSYRYAQPQILQNGGQSANVYFLNELRLTCA